MLNYARKQEDDYVEWEHEPDRVEFRFKGLPCLVVRNVGVGNLCGYVAVPPGHPLHGQTSEDPKSKAHDLDVHGGITFTDSCNEGGKICHVPQPGEPDNVWWFGFDCAHGGDYIPMTQKVSGRKPDASFESYRDIGYVIREVCDLATQLAAMESGVG